MQRPRRRLFGQFRDDYDGHANLNGYYYDDTLKFTEYIANRLLLVVLLSLLSVVGLRTVAAGDLLVAPNRAVTRFITNAEGKTVDLGPTLERIAKGEQERCHP